VAVGVGVRDGVGLCVWLDPVVPLTVSLQGALCM
jgi:hypothetical protein